MAAGTAKLLKYGRSGDINGSGVRYEAIYQVITTDQSDGPAIVAAASGVPRYGDIYNVGNEVDFGLTVTSILPEQDRKSPFRWEVRVTWTTPQSDPANPPNSQPHLRPAIVRWLHEEFTEIMEKDVNGTLVATFHGEKFKPPLEVTRYRPVLHIERNFLAFNDSLQFDYIDSVNSDTWLSATARKWRCKMFQVDPMFENNFAYKRVTAEFVFNKNEWTKEVLHAGYKHFASTASTQVIEIPNRRVPVFLTTAGYRTTDVSYLTFFPHSEQPFNALGLI